METGLLLDRINVCWDVPEQGAKEDTGTEDRSSSKRLEKVLQ